MGNDTKKSSQQARELKNEKDKAEQPTKKDDASSAKPTSPKDAPTSN